METLESTSNQSVKAPQATSLHRRKITRSFVIDRQGKPVLLPDNLYGDEALAVVGRALNGGGVYHSIMPRKLPANVKGNDEPAVWCGGKKVGWADPGLQTFEAWSDASEEEIVGQIKATIKFRTPFMPASPRGRS